MKMYKNLIYAGTFDRLHAGHKKLLNRAFELAEKVAIGITSDEMVKNKPLSNVIQSLDLRIKNLEDFLKEKKYFEKANIFVLKDIYGPSTKDNSFDSILVTELTSKNAETINENRLNKKLKPLKIIVEPLLRGEDGEVISSEKIRLGEIDEEGHSFWLSVISSQSKELDLPKEMRGELRKPLGKVVNGTLDQLQETVHKVIKLIKLIKPTLVISVGDIITESLFKAGFEPNVRIIDFRSRRRKVTVTMNINSKKLNKFINKPGTLNIKTSIEIKNTIKKFLETSESQLIVIDGEEDLLALPAILFAPLHSVVLYGQFDMGVVVVEVNERIKKRVKNILLKFY